MLLVTLLPRMWRQITEDVQPCHVMKPNGTELNYQTSIGQCTTTLSVASHMGLGLSDYFMAISTRLTTDMKYHLDQLE